MSNKQTNPSSNSSSSRPSIHLSLNKKRRFTPPPVPPHLVRASDIAVLHQVSDLDLVLVPDIESPNWICQGRTCLYVIDQTPQDVVKTTATTSTVHALALHLRRTCQVESIRVECLAVVSKDIRLQQHHASWHHADPLQHVLTRPATTFEAPDANSTYRFDADAQCSRGAVGMTNGLRAASIASNMGELRLSVASAAPCTRPHAVAAAVWKQDLKRAGRSASTSAASTSPSGHVADKLCAQTYERHQSRREKRLDLIANRLAEACCRKEGNRAFKITVEYKIPATETMHLAGVHFITDSNRSPHVYTTTGSYGDHEGPRSWLPCLDSASIKHRASQELGIKVTASLREGLSCVGMGEDFGVSKTLLHDLTSDQNMVRGALGDRHFELLQPLAAEGSRSRSGSHIIPPGQATIDTIQATFVWASCSWAPIPARSLGFAVGPFKVLEDPEYFSPSSVEMSTTSTIPFQERYEEFLQTSRERGEGIRQVYFAPIFERKHIHSDADTCLLPDTIIKLQALSAIQVDAAEQMDTTVIYSTVGVTHRALSLMRDVLALPSFRTASYTQVWIPNAVHGGTSSGAMHACPEVLVNPFLGGAIMDSQLLPPVGSRLPYYEGGCVLQFLQARNAMRGWIISAIPLGGNDDVGNGYLLALIEALIMSLYERGHGAHGEGGAKGSVFYCKRYAGSSGMNSSNLDFLPIQNIEEMDVVIDGVGAVPTEERPNEHLWRSAANGSESHTSSQDEFQIRQLLCRDAVEALERGSDKDKYVPMPSMGWFGSHLSLSFLSSNASASTELGCGAVELLHPVGGLVYRSLKVQVLRSIIEGRAGISSFIRLVRATFLSAHLEDIGEKELVLPSRRNKSANKDHTKENEMKDEDSDAPRPPFVVCVNEILKKEGLTHTLFTRALQNLAGKIREPHLLGTLVDVEPRAEDPRTRRPFVNPEGFPNSFVRGSSLLYCRVGVHVELGREGGASQAQSSSVVSKGIQLQAFAEPVIPQGGIAFGGPITMRVVENEGQFREFVKELVADGSRRDWGTTFLLAKPVTTTKAQTAASGVIESSSSQSKDAMKLIGRENVNVPSLDTPATYGPFSIDNLHSGGYQAIELIRLANLTPLLWVRVDPLYLYGGRISVCQPDACLAEQLFHDGDAAAQVEAMRTLAERPLRIQSSSKVSIVYDVAVAELPVRVLGDCLRGSPALHSSLSHTPAVRAQAALAIAQWQNNKAPPTKGAVGVENWIGANLLFQYFRERFYSNSVVMPLKFTRLIVKKSDAGMNQAEPEQSGGPANPKSSVDDSYQYLDALADGEERAVALEEAEEVEMEEDEEYRVRSAVVLAIACIRAKDGLTPSFVIRFLETVLESNDAEMPSNFVFPEEELMAEKAFRKGKENSEGSESDKATSVDDEGLLPPLSCVSSMTVANTLLSLCYVNATPDVITDPTTGKLVQTAGRHPVQKLIDLARGWLDWELYREKIRCQLMTETATGISGNCHNIIAAAAVVGLTSLVILKQSTTDAQVAAEDQGADDTNKEAAGKDISSSAFYMEIYDSEPSRNDLTKAACAQAIVCICCAADRFELPGRQPVGLLTSLEFLLQKIIDKRTSVSLRHTLALLMMDACTGKICSFQRVGSVAGRNDLIGCATRLLNGPLGASHGGDYGSAILLTISHATFPAANAVNDGARRGLRLIRRAGLPQENFDEALIVRVAQFGTRLYRTINGEPCDPPTTRATGIFDGVCAFDGLLRTSLLALWQWLWPKGCVAVLQVQAWKSHEGTKRYVDMGAHLVMKISDEEKAAAAAEENSIADIDRLVRTELDRQAWRGEMAQKAYDLYKVSSGQAAILDVAAAEQGIGQPLPPIERDAAFRQGGWIASAARQRREKNLDGGGAVTKVKARLTVKTSNAD